MALVILTGLSLPLSLSRSNYPFDTLTSNGHQGRPIKRIPLRAVGLKGLPNATRAVQAQPAAALPHDRPRPGRATARTTSFAAQPRCVPPWHASFAPLRC